MALCAKPLTLASYFTYYLVVVLLSTEYTKAEKDLGPEILPELNECSLNPRSRARIYSEATSVWTITDKVLRQLDNDLQKIIDCTKENDILYFKTAQTITPKATMTIPWNLTIAAAPKLSTTTSQDEDSEEENLPVSFTCPNTGGVIISKSRWLTISNVQFIECDSSGTIISVELVCRGGEEDGQIQIYNVEFMYNSLYSSQRILDFKYPYCSSLSMYNVFIHNNTCDATDCIALPSTSTLTSINVTQNAGHKSRLPSQAVFFLPNQSQVFATLINASRNEIRVFGMEAYAALKLTESKFHDNCPVLSSTSFADVGGGVLYTKDSKVSIERCTFDSNTAPHGGVLFGIRSQVKISECSFKENLAKDSSSRVYLDDSLGGALFINCSTLRVSQSFFESNEAAYNGAVLFAVHSTVTVQLTEVMRNKNKRGGSIHLYKCAAELNGVMFRENSAQFGSALDARGSDIIIEASMFVRNNGGAGSAASLLGTNATISRSSFSGNNAKSPGTLRIEGGHKVDIKECRFEENIAYAGGAINVRGENRVEIIASYVSCNIARGMGGGVYVARGAKFISTRTYFTSNKVEGRLGYGGGVFSMSSEVFFYSSILESNTGKYGGGIAISYSSARILNCNITSNHASRNGGRVYSEKSTVYFNDSFVIYNRAVHNGGGIIATERTRLIGEELMVFGNSAVKKGGGLALMSGSVYNCSSCKIIDNSAKIGPDIFEKLPLLTT